ncbi:hypothetical protein REPUB_Repub11eG0063200 [Reevesia pubescens]
MQSNGRVIWVACYGIPIHAWTLETFQNIAEGWGDFVQMDSVTLEMNGFNKGCMQINTTLLSRIEESFDLQVGDKLFPVKAIEINHDCEFTGPCYYEELNVALKKLGLDNIDVQNNAEEDSNGGEAEELGSVGRDEQPWQEKQTPGHVSHELPRWTNEKASSWVEITRRNTTISAACIDVEAIKVVGNDQCFDGVVDDVHAQPLSRPCMAVVDSSLPLVDWHEASNRVEKDIEDHMNGHTILDLTLESPGTINLDLNCDGSNTNDDLSKALVVWNEGRVKEIEEIGPPRGWPVNMNRAVEDVLNMGLVEYPDKPHGGEKGVIEVEVSQSFQEDKLEFDVARVSKAKKLKKWRWVKEVAEEE